MAARLTTVTRSDRAGRGHAGPAKALAAELASRRRSLLSTLAVPLARPILLFNVAGCAPISRLHSCSGISLACCCFGRLPVGLVTNSKSHVATNAERSTHAQRHPTLHPRRRELFFCPTATQPQLLRQTLSIRRPTAIPARPSLLAVAYPPTQFARCSHRAAADAEEPAVSRTNRVRSRPHAHHCSTTPERPRAAGARLQRPCPSLALNRKSLNAPA